MAIHADKSRKPPNIESVDNCLAAKCLPDIVDSNPAPCL